MPRGRRPDPAAVQAAKGNSRKRSAKELARMQRAEEAAAKTAAADDALTFVADAPAMPADDLASHPAPHRSSVPDAPAHLSAEACSIWDRLAPDLVRLKFLRSTDEPAFERYCENLATYWRNAELLKDEGTVVMTSSPHVQNMPRSNPRFLQQMRIEQMLQSMEDRFGMNPAGRQRILLGLASRPQQLPFDDPNRTKHPDGATDSAQGSGAEAPAPAQGENAIGFLKPQRLN